LKYFQDWFNFRYSKYLLSDTNAHFKYWEELFGAYRGEHLVFPVLADMDIYHPSTNEKMHEKIQILFYGSFIPLHGIDVILNAFSIMEKNGLEFEAKIIGNGQTFKEMKVLFDTLNLKNVKMTGEIVSEEVLANEIRGHDIVLGIFGNSRKASSVIPNKVYQATACKKCTVTMLSDVLYEFYGENDLITCENTPQQLASTLSGLIHNPQQMKETAENGYSNFLKIYDNAKSVLTDFLINIDCKAQCEMKVLQFIASKGWGGAEKSFVELCNALSKKIQIEVLLFKENQIEDRLDPNIKVHRLSSLSDRHNPFLYFDLLKVIKTVNPSIVHSHSAKASEIMHRMNTFISVKQVATKRNSRKGSIFNKLDNVTALSKNVAESISKEDVDIIYNGLVKESFKLENASNPTFTIAAIGRLDAIKGFDILIREVCKLKFPFHLNIIGDGEERKHLTSLINDLGLSEKVTLFGFREDIPSLIASSDLVVVSSHSEGFGRVLVETLFYGKLIISTKVGLSIEILPDELLIDGFEIAKKIEAAYNDREHYETLFRQVQEKRTEDFLVENILQKYIDLYERI